MSRNAQEAHQTHGSPQLVALPGSNLFSHISSFSMASSINLEAWMGVIERKPPALNALPPGGADDLPPPLYNEATTK